METKEIVEAYQNEFIRVANVYNDLVQDFDKYRGKEVTKENEETINNLLSDIQIAYGQLSPFFLFIIHNYEMSKHGVNGYNEFIDHLVRSGAIIKEETH